MRWVAEEKGFEPSDGCPSTVFKTAAFDHSATPPTRSFLTRISCYGKWFRVKSCLAFTRRRVRSGDREAEGTGLLNLRRGNPTGGSNPPRSAIHAFPKHIQDLDELTRLVFDFENVPGGFLDCEFLDYFDNVRFRECSW